MSTTIRFGLRIPPCASATAIAACVSDAERAGFDLAWLPDSQFLWRDVWACLALAATATQRIGLGTCVTNLETRHPSVTAAAAATIAEMAPGRVVLGVGSGDSATKTLGLRPTRVAVMEERIVDIERLLAGAEVTFGDRSMKLHTTPSQPVPIYLAANGPRMIELAGRRCAGALVLTGFRPDMIVATREIVDRGRAGRLDEPSAFDLCIGTMCHVTDDAAEAAHIVKPYVVATAQTGGAATLRALGIDIDPPAVVAGIYPDMSHAEDWDAAADAAGEWVTDDMARRYAETYCVIGNADYVTDRFQAAVAAGATSFYVRHPGTYTLPTALLETFGSEVIPRLSNG
jgi:5,10-methylenetetrahydromethanopterin reductase